MILRPYQDRLISEARVSLRTHASVLIQLVTGGGKTALSTQMLRTVAAKNRRGYFLCHRVELVEQTISTFKAFDLPYGVISAGFTPHLMQPIQICSIDTLRYRLRSGRALPDPSLVIWDEAQHTPASSWAFVRGHFSTAKHIGLSATPERLDGKGLRPYFEDMVQGPSCADMITDGYLSPYRAFAPSAPDMTGVHTKMGDYVKAEATAAMDRPTITGDAVSHYLRLARDKRGLVFCVSVEHSKHVAAQFKAAGILAWHLDGETDRGERRQAMEAFRRGEIKVLTNVDLFSEGLDVPDAEVCIMLRPTKSLSMYLQQVGRVLRPMPGKTALILDHAGNIARHGLPDDDREWSLDGREARKRAADSESVMPVRQCPRCYHCHRTAPVCPSCGWAYESQARQVDEVDGTLAEVDIAAQRHAARVEQARAETVEALIELGRKRGYRSPEKWAAHLWTARLAKRAPAQ